MSKFDRIILEIVVYELCDYMKNIEIFFLYSNIIHIIYKWLHTNCVPIYENINQVAS